MIQINLELAKRLIGDKSLSNSAFRVLLYLMSNPKPTNPKELSAVLGISQKAICKSIKKLADAGIIQKGELGGRQRMFNVPGHEPSEPDPEPEPDKGGNDERFRRIEAMLEVMLSDIAYLKSARPIPEMVQSEPQMTHITPIFTPSIPITSPQVEPHIIASSSIASFNKSSISSFGEFMELFGVQVPIGADPLAVAEMIRRKKSGKLENVKSPLGYLASITGKVGASVTPSAAVPTTCRPMLEAVDMRRIELERRAREMWNAMGDGEKKPFLDIGSKVKESRYKTPVELLARSEFTRQMLSQHGFAI